MNMFALSDADPGEESDARILVLVPSPQKTNKYPNSIKKWTF